MQLELLSSFPVGASRAADRLAEAVSLAETTRALASRGETAQLTMLHHRVADPVDLGIASDGLVCRIDENDFEESIGRVRADPVGVEDSQASASSTNSLL